MTIQGKTIRHCETNSFLNSKCDPKNDKQTNKQTKEENSGQGGQRYNHTKSLLTESLMLAPTLELLYKARAVVVIGQVY